MSGWGEKICHPGALLLWGCTPCKDTNEAALSELQACFLFVFYCTKWCWIKIKFSLVRMVGFWKYKNGQASPIIVYFTNNILNRFSLKPCSLQDAIIQSLTTQDSFRCCVYQKHIYVKRQTHAEVKFNYTNQICNNLFFLLPKTCSRWKDDAALPQRLSWKGITIKRSLLSSQDRENQWVCFSSISCPCSSTKWFHWNKADSQCHRI